LIINDLTVRINSPHAPEPTSHRYCAEIHLLLIAFRYTDD